MAKKRRAARWAVKVGRETVGVSRPIIGKRRCVTTYRVGGAFALAGTIRFAFPPGAVKLGFRPRDATRGFFFA